MEQNTEYCPSVGFEPSMDGLQLDALTNDSHSQFLTAWIVGHELYDLEML